MTYFTGLLDQVFDRDDSIGVVQGCLVECSRGMRGEVFDTDAVVGGSQGCWIECLTGMLNPFFTGMLEYLVTKCCTSCLTGMPDEVFHTDAGSIFDRSAGCFREEWIKL